MYATMSLEDSVIERNTSSGLYLQNTQGEVLRNDITNNGTYGMVCSSANIDSCRMNDLSNNASGEHDGCPTRAANRTRLKQNPSPTFSCNKPLI